jgi:exonuclease III
MRTRDEGVNLPNNSLRKRAISCSSRGRSRDSRRDISNHLINHHDEDHNMEHQRAQWRSKQRTLRDCIHVENPDILLLQETKCFREEVEDIFRCFWRVCESLHTDSNGATGGLEILWNPTTVIIDQPFSTVGMLTTHFKVIGSNKEGMITNTYRPQSAHDKELFLKRIATIKTLMDSSN